MNVLLFALAFVVPVVCSSSPTEARNVQRLNFLTKGVVSLIWSDLSFEQDLVEVSEKCSKGIEDVITGLENGETWAYRCKLSL